MKFVDNSSNQMAQTYNSVGRNTGTTANTNSSSSDNGLFDFFKKKAKSAENFFGTTLSTIPTAINTTNQNMKTEQMLEDNSTKMDNVAKQFGYNSYNDILKAMDTAEANGDTETFNAIQNNDALWEALQNQSAANVETAKENNENFRDYVQNDYASQKINQDRGKYLGSGINTLSTAFDIMAPGAGVLANGIQGGIEGIADELEENGLQNFNWQNAGQRAATGAISGLATGGLNKKINTNIATGNASKLGNWVNNKLSTNASDNLLTSGLKSAGTGAIRGAMSGAVGGAVGAGTSSALAGQDIGTGIENTISGALTGAATGATTGGIMGAANNTLNQIPAVNRFNQTMQQAGDDFNTKKAQSGFGEAMKQTWEESPTKPVVEKTAEFISEKLPIGNTIEKVGNKNTQINNADDAANDLINLYKNGASWNDLKDVAAGYEMSKGINADEIMSKAYSGLSSSNTTQTTNGLQEQIRQDVIAQRQAMSKGDIETVNTLGKRINENRAKLNGESTQTTSATSEQPTAEETQIYNTFTKKQPTVETEQQDLTKLAKAKNLRETSAKELLSQVGTVNARAAKADNMVENVQTLSKMGLTTPEEWEVASDLMTGRNGKLSKLHTKIMANAGEVNTMDGAMKNESLNDTIDRLIKDTGLTDSEATSTKNIIEGKLNKLSSRRTGSITGTDDAMEVMDVIRDLESRARDLKGQNSANNKMTDPAREDKAKVIDSVADILEERIYDNVGDISKYMTDDVISELKSAFPDNEKWAYAIDNDVATIKDAKSLRAAQKKFVQTSDYLANARGNFGTYGQRVGDTANNILAKGLSKIPVVGGFASELANTAPVNRTFANINNARANKLEGITGETLLTSKKLGNAQNSASEGVQAQNTTTTPIQTENGSSVANNGQLAQNNNAGNTLETQIYNAIGRTTGEQMGDNARSYLQEAVNETTTETPNVSSDETALYNALTNTGTTGTTTTGATTGTGTTTSTGNKYLTTDNTTSTSSATDYNSILERAVELALEAGDANAYATLLGMYQEAQQAQQESESESGVQSWSSSAKSDLSEALNGLDQIDTLEQLYNEAGGGQGWLAGSIANLGASIGDINTSGKAYNQYANSIGSALVKNLVNLGATESDVARYVDYIPSLSDTQESAEIKLSALRKLYNDIIDNLYSVNGQ